MDRYYRLAKSEGYRARSAYKLLHVEKKYNIFNDVKRVVDLCAAPGSWSQVLARQLKQYNDSIIVSVDLQEIAPIDDVIIIRGDITTNETMEKIEKAMNNELVDLVVSDGAPDVTGVHEVDEFVQNQLVISALSVAIRLLKNGGSFVAKIFKSDGYELLRSQLSLYFDMVECFKPSSSRPQSAEHFVVCKKKKECHIDESILTPFMAYGDLNHFKNL